MSDYISSALSSEEKDAWATPQWLFAALDSEFRFHLDAAANQHNKKCSEFITADDDALSMEDWGEITFTDMAFKSVWLNPPYSRGMIKQFMDKAYEQCLHHKMTVVLLVPATIDAGWWPMNATEIRLITHGRISFEHPISKKPINGNTKGSAIIIFKYSDLNHPTVTRYIKRDTLREVGLAALQQTGAQA